MTASIPNGLSRSGRKKVSIQAGDLAFESPLDSGSDLPWVIRPRFPEMSLADWVASHRERLAAQVLRYGGLLFRGFDVPSAGAFAHVAEALTPNLEAYKERAASRREVGGHVYTSTEFPSEHPIPLHHEMSYSNRWPSAIWFYCATPATRGGCTPIADDRRIFELIDPAVRDTFIRRKVMYVRNYGEGADLPWQEAFQTDDPRQVESYCAQSGITVEWRGGGRLRTRQVRDATVTHPITGDSIWFNHAHVFHMSSLTPAVREALSSEFRDDELPRNAFYGDGSPIEAAVLDDIRALYDRMSVRFSWQQGDVLLLDNILVSHGRDPFEGERRILVAMADLHTPAASTRRA